MHKRLKPMELLVIIAAVIACTCATPVVELLHPSPVNPDVLVAVKPKERIILITDPKEITKFKRESKQPLLPTVLPEKDELHTTKKDHKSEIKSFQVGSDDKNLSQKSQDPNKPNLNTRSRRNVEFQHTQGILPSETKQNSDKDSLKIKSEVFHQEKADEKQKTQGLPAVVSLHQETGNPGMQLKQTQKENNESGKKSEVSFNGSNKKESDKENDQQGKHVLSEMLQKTQELPAIFSPSKRDIPVPLVAKHHHPEESPNENIKKESHEVEMENRVTNEQFQKPQTPTLVLKEITKEIEQYKRDIPVPLVPKHHHPEESPKDLDNHEHFIKIERVKPQLLPAIIKETNDFTQQQKRETLKPFSSNHGYSKDKESHEGNKNSEVKLENHMPHPTPTQGHKHITDNFHKPQVLPVPLVYNKEQIMPTNTQKTQVWPSAYQQKPTVDYHPKESKTGSNHGKKEVKEDSVEHSNKHNKEQDSLFTQQEHKPNILDDILRNRDLETSTTEHPLIRNRPVPVAELFSRAHGN